VLAYPAIAACARSTRRTVVLAGFGVIAALLHQWGAPVAPLYIAGVAVFMSAELRK
jgi:hypothetical protein